jgi:hypothetical protein
MAGVFYISGSLGRLFEQDFELSSRGVLSSTRQVGSLSAPGCSTLIEVVCDLGR